MKIAMIGTGYVGLVSGACFSEFGVVTTCIDKDTNKITLLTRGELPLYEDGLDTLVKKNMNAGRLNFTTDLASGVQEADVIFIAVGTPSRRGDGHADLTYVFEVARELALCMDSHYKVIVTKSTIPVGTSRRVREVIRDLRPDGYFDICSNPEFLRQGSAITDFLHPNRVIIGIDSERALQVMKILYRPLYLLETPIVFTTLETAELIKYASNSFLATKITFMNELADLCEKLGTDIQDVAKGMGLDRRIGSKFLHVGPGYGGSCFPKDTLALTKLAQEQDCSMRIVKTVIDVNNQRKQNMVDKIIQIMGGSLEGKTIAILGVTFKPNTDDMRESAALVIIPGLQRAGARIHAYDPVGMKNASLLLPKVMWCVRSYDTLKHADAVIVLTEWNEFRALDLIRVKRLLRHPIVIDLRNIYKRHEMEQAGLCYFSLGRPPSTSSSNTSSSNIC